MQEVEEEEKETMAKLKQERMRTECQPPQIDTSSDEDTDEDIESDVDLRQ